MNELTDETMVIVTRLGDFWVTPERADKILSIKHLDPIAIIELDGNHISAQVIDGALKAADYDTLQKKWRGAWQCRWRYWHERREECAHHLMK